MYGNRSPRKDFFNFSRGKFALRCEPDHKDAVKRTYQDKDNAEKVVFERRYDALTGRLTNIERVKRTMNKGQAPYWVFHFDDGGQEFTLSLPYSSGWAKMILLRMPNIDIKRPFTLEGCLFGEKDTAIMVKQEDNSNADEKTGNIRRYWIPKESKELPPMIPPGEGFGGSDKWDDTSQNQFLWEWIVKNVLPEITIVTQAVTQEPVKETPSIEETVKEPETSTEFEELQKSDEESDLPF
ncbi:hypothetical protein LCGC14_0337190 [marine sediment metagenome]|uniref:Uncharacterized protein n=1 Tax=marine sediment metagenome TaxID=412755 RepID=A0A0F9TXL1_9ZZZZ